jgi:hypothetical protein
LIWAGVGISCGIWLARRREWTFFLVTAGLLSFVLSLGSNVDIAGWQPWHWLASYVPGFAQVRSAFRFVYFVHLVVVLAAAQGVDGAWDWVSRWLQRRRGAARSKLWPVGAALALIVLGVAAVADPWPPRLRLGVVPEVGPHRDWIDLLKTSPQPGAVLCLPMAGGDHVRDFEITTEWMILGTYHGRPLVNGFSGFFPARYLKLREETWSGQVPDSSLEELYKEGVRFVAVDRRRFKVDWGDGAQTGQVAVKRLLQNAAGVDLYQLAAATPEPIAPANTQ